MARRGSNDAKGLGLRESRLALGVEGLGLRVWGESVSENLDWRWGSRV
jgi:hypothetical protein